jgi:hypothetical protein
MTCIPDLRHRALSRASRALLGGLVLALLVVPAVAAVPTDAVKRAALVGQPASVSVQPSSITLAGPRAMQQVIVTGHYADGTVRDLTPFAAVVPEAADIALVGSDGLLRPRKNGTTSLVVKAGGLAVRVPVTVKDFDRPQPVSFRNEFIAALNVGGCNQGACHGTPSGKGGFRLSLRGYDPAADYEVLTREAYNRRTDLLEPDASLILQKALGRVPHEGGQRFRPDTVPVGVLRHWLAEGLQDDPASRPAVQAIEVLPGTCVHRAPAIFQQLAVLARFRDGTIRDVTPLTVFSSSDSAVADVGSTGLVEFRQAGEVAILCRYLEIMHTVRLTYLEPRANFVWSNPPENNYVDKHIFAKLKMLNILPSELCSDDEFVRRAYLDLCGILPSPVEVQAFLGNPDKDKRSKLIDKLLDRDECPDFWTLKWADVLRNNRKAVQLKGTHVFQQWLRAHIARNTPLDEVIRELLTASGSTFANPPANYYRIARDPTSLAETTAQLFFGVRMQCAKCHNHPFERWTQDDYYSMAAFFARVRQKGDTLEPAVNPQTPGAEVIYSDRSGDVTQPRSGKVMPPKLPGIAAPSIPPGKDRRQVLAEMITAPDNPFFARSIVNRIWYHLNGRGIVDPVDDFRDSNPSANDDLLDALSSDFTAHRFDVKHVIRTIMNSRTYQLSAQTNDTNKDDAKYFSHAVTKLLTAEQLLDALCAVTEVPEKFAGMPPGTRAVQLPDGEVNHPFLKTFGQPARELACECERESDSNLAQALQLINGPTVNEKLRAPTNRIGRLMGQKASDSDLLNELYLAALSRLPAEGEVKAALEHVNRPEALNKPDGKRKAWEDVLWALINSKEFLFRH